MAVSVRDLIRPARPAMILSGVLTAAGAVLGIVPFVALTQLAAVWLRERSDPGWSGNPWLLIGIAAGALLGAQLLYLAGIGVTPSSGGETTSPATPADRRRDRPAAAR